jgi:hypothetical protein
MGMWWKKKGIAKEFQIFLIPTVEMLKEEIWSLRNLSFLKIVKIEPANKVQSFFFWKRSLHCS